MKRLFSLPLALTALLASAGLLWALTNVHTHPFAAGEGNGFDVSIEDTDVNPSDTYALMTEQSAAFTQLTASKRVVFTNNGTDSLTAWVSGVDSANQYYKVHKLVAAGSGGKDTTDYAFYGIESFWIDKETDGTCVLTPVGGSAMNTIPAGAIHRSPALRLFGSTDLPRIDQITAVATDSLRVDVEVRVYEDLADLRDLGDGYAVRAGGRIDPTGGPATWTFPQPLQLSNNSFIAVFSRGPTAASVRVNVQGRRGR